MLRSWSIRKKLIAGLTCLTAIFGVITTSGILGIERYESLADEIKNRAVEIQYSHKLNWSAESLLQSHQQIEVLDNKESLGMLDGTLLKDQQFQIQLERDEYNTAHDQFELYLEKYAEHIATVAELDERSLLVDQNSLSQNLQKIRDLFLDIPKYEETTTIYPNLPDKEKLIELVTTTHYHFELIHSGMTLFRADVRRQYIGWAWTWGLCITGAICLIGALIWLSYSLVVKPFQTLVSGSRLVAGGQFGHKIDLGTKDELSELADAMNAMSQRFLDTYEKERKLNKQLEQKVRDRTRELIKNEQLASVGFLAAGVAHEINNPLAAIAFSAEELGENVEDLSALGPTPIEKEIYSQLHKNLRRIHDQAFRCKGITDRLLDFSRLEDSTRSQTDLKPLVEELAEMVVKVGKYRCKTLRTHCDDDVLGYCNKQEIQQVVLNLITNALESVSTEGAVDVYVKHIDNFAAVVVEDNGCGMDAETIEHLFEPFYTRRQDGTGTGLGLSISYRIVSQHQGSLSAESDGVGKGSTMTLCLPIPPAIEPTQKNEIQDYTYKGTHESQEAA